MEQAIWVGYGLLVAVCWVLGLRALHTARRTRNLLDGGLGAVVLFALVFPPGIASAYRSGGTGLSPLLASGVAGVAILAVLVAAIAFAAGSRRPPGAPRGAGGAP